jgi:hypothetical protein
LYGPRHLASALCSGVFAIIGNVVGNLAGRNSHAAGAVAV